MLFVRACPGCGRTCAGLCRPCRSRLDGPLRGPAPAGVTRLTALTRYDDHSRRLVLAAKNGRRRDVLRSLGRSLARALAADPARDAGFDVVTWVPASVEGRSRRGYDQGRLLARVVGAELGLPAVGLLVRGRGPNTAARRGMARTERLAGPELSAVGRVPGRVLLVDDVVTTGSTMAAAATALRSAGAVSVDGGALAVRVFAGVRTG